MPLLSVSCSSPFLKASTLCLLFLSLPECLYSLSLVPLPSWMPLLSVSCSSPFLNAVSLAEHVNSLFFSLFFPFNFLLLYFAAECLYSASLVLLHCFTIKMPLSLSSSSSSLVQPLQHPERKPHVLQDVACTLK